MKYVILVILTATACSDNDLSDTSVFDTEQTDGSDFDKWLTANYVNTYNIRYNYRYIDKETSLTQALIPAEEDKAVALAIMLKHVWLDAFAEVAGEDFLKGKSPMVIQLVGTPAYQSNGNIVPAVYEGGTQALIYNVNSIDIDSPMIETEDPFVDITAGTSDINYWCFKTMTHLLCHQLTGQKTYSEDFQTITPGYNSSGWIALMDSIAPTEGFVSGYASREYDDDFAETFAIYVTHSEAAWQTILEKAGSEEMQTALLSKLEIISDYFKGSWEIDIDELREVILRRYSEAKDLDLRTLN